MRTPADSAWIQALYSSVGRTIRDARNAAGVPVSELARACAITPNHLQKIELGETACALHVLVKVANHLDTNLDDLVPVTVDEDERSCA